MFIIKLAIIGAALLVGGYAVLSFVSGMWPFGGRGSGDGDGSGTIVVEAIHDIMPEEILPEEPSPLLIEVREERIFYDGEELDIDALAVVLARHSGSEETWRLQDAFRADNATFNRVRELLWAYDIYFVEG